MKKVIVLFNAVVVGTLMVFNFSAIAEKLDKTISPSESRLHDRLSCNECCAFPSTEHAQDVEEIDTQMSAMECCADANT